MKILLAEDVRAVAALMAARLQSFGHEVILAENGRIAVELFRSEAPDLILMDITMPEVDGFGAASRIRAIEATQQWAWTPILFLTATDTVENLIAAIEAGGDDFIPKTVPEPVLQAKMKALARIAALRQQLIRANRQLQNLAIHDGLTGLYNRRHLDLLLDAAWAEAVRTRQPFGIYMLDIDNFKKYNDHYGHHAGDACLRSVAAAIAGAVTAANQAGLTGGAFPARYGGEEFVVVVPGASAEAYARLADAMLATVRQLNIPHQQNPAHGVVTLSIGGMRVDAAEGELAQLFRAADQRLYQAKAAGRNRALLA